MRETLEFRIPEEDAARWLKKSDGVTLGGSVRKLFLDVNDPRMQVICEAQREMMRQDDCFFTGWDSRRTYSNAELEAAELFQLQINTFIRVSGEEGGTEYDEKTACQHCGAGAHQVGPLFLGAKYFPRKSDFGRTIAKEIVISNRASELFLHHGITGASFLPVRTMRTISGGWSQLVVQSVEADIVAPTRFGNNPFDDDPKGEHKCRTGDLLGLNLLSEVSIRSRSRPSVDIFASRQFVGVRRGVLRPERVLFVSKKLHQLIKRHELKGCQFEVVHLV